METHTRTPPTPHSYRLKAVPTYCPVYFPMDGSFDDREKAPA